MFFTMVKVGILLLVNVQVTSSPGDRTTPTPLVGVVKACAPPPTVFTQVRPVSAQAPGTVSTAEYTVESGVKDPEASAACWLVRVNGVLGVRLAGVQVKADVPLLGCDAFLMRSPAFWGSV